MRYLMPACVLVVLGLLAGAPQAGEKKGGLKKEERPTPPWASVTVGGEIRDLIEVRGKLNVGVLLDIDQPKLTVPWDGPPPERESQVKPKGKGPDVHVRSMQVGEASWVVTLLDDADPNLEKELPLLRPPQKGGLRVVMHGRLAAAKDRDPFVAHAKAWGTMHVQKDDAKLPLGVGSIEIIGEAVPGKHEIGKGEFTSLAIQNGWSPILVTGKGLERAAQPKGMLSVSGKLIVSRTGPLVIDAQSVSVAKPPQK